VVDSSGDPSRAGRARRVLSIAAKAGQHAVPHGTHPFAGFGRAPTDRELSEELGISVEDVRVLTRASRSSLSLNEPVDSDGDSELGDLLEQTGLPDTDELLLRESFSRALSDALAELPERERKVLELRFGLSDDQPKTLREIGEVMGLSRERVRQIESRALNKLRRSHKKHSLQGFLR
jgi:RNA polymerase primary sigma factor